MALNGVILLSSILNYGIEQSGYDQSYITYLPSYAATAWYHNKLANKPADLAAFLQEVRNWTAGPYASALEKGSDLTPAETDAIAKQLSAYTGLSVQFIKQAHLRVSPARFRKELLRDEHHTIGRYDARFTGVDVDDAGESAESRFGFRRFTRSGSMNCRLILRNFCTIFPQSTSASNTAVRIWSTKTFCIIRWISGWWLFRSAPGRSR